MGAAGRYANAAATFVVMAIVAMGQGGCAADAKRKQEQAFVGNTFTITQQMAKLDPMLVRAEVTAFADTCSTTVAQACDQMSEKTKRREVANYALEQKIATATTMITNGSAPNALGGMFDSVIYASLLRHSVEAHWIPTLLHDEGDGLLTTCRRNEADAWTMLGKIANQEQCDELRREIENWKRDHPDEYYVGFIRFSDLSAFREVGGNPKQLVPSSVFSLLYINPLPDLDPVASELRSYRLLTERFKYVMMRMPMVFSWHTQEAIARIDNMPQMKAFVDNTGRVADATKTFADAMAEYPKTFSGERKAAIEQMFTGLDVQRQALLKDLDTQQKWVAQALADAQKSVAQVRDAGTAINDSTAQTLRNAELSSQRVITQTTRAVILIIVVASVFPLAAMLLYRYACRRMLSPVGERRVVEIAATPRASSPGGT